MPERQTLLKGFEYFRQEYYEHTHLMDKLAREGTHPDFFFIGCIDPRSGLQTIFHADPGRMFGDRVMAALVPPYEEGSDFNASLTYAVKYKQVKHIVILGHTQCGGIEALVSGLDDSAIAGWMQNARPALERARQKPACHDHETLCAETEKQAVILGLHNLLTYPAVREAFEAGAVTINGWLFDMKAGEILGYDPDENEFLPLSDQQTETTKLRKTV